MHVQNRILTTVLLALSLAGAEAETTIEIDATAPRVAVSPGLHGIFFEEINHAGEGGLYAELVQNRDFEANTLPQGCRIETNYLVTPLNWSIKKWFDSDLPGWSMVSEGSAEGTMRQDATLPLNDRNPHSLRLTVRNNGERCGVANEGYWGMNFQKGEWYDLSFYARTEGGAKMDLAVTLESNDGRKTYARANLTGIGGDWKKYNHSFKAEASDPKGRMIITPSNPGTVWFDVVSLFPRETFKHRPNGMRPDLAQLLADLRPGFLRFPGGCIVEGITLENRIRWRDSIGDIARRHGGFDLWGYYNTYGLGFHEYLQLCEDLGADALYVVNAGMSCKFRSKDRKRGEIATATELATYVQDTLDALEYAMGPATSKFGALRAGNGRAEPFKLKYVEIGNENSGEEYRQNYKVFFDAIKARYPQVTTIADTRLKEIPMEMVDDHYYVSPDRFFQMADRYDDADRNSPKIYVGEYAVNKNVGAGNLLGALAEAVFMLGMERNADVVKMCSYAPLFENVNDRQWPVNLILFDSARCVGRSSYQVQKMFAANRPDEVLQTRVEEARVQMGTNQIQQLYALAGFDRGNNELILKAVNPTALAITASVAIKGFSRLRARAKVVTLNHSDASAENSLDQPNAIAPAESEFRDAGEKFRYTFKPYSLTLIRLSAAR